MECRKRKDLHMDHLDHITLVLTAAAMLLAEWEDEQVTISEIVLSSPATYHASDIQTTLHIRGETD